MKNNRPVPAGKLLLAALLPLILGAAACDDFQDDPRDQSYEIQTPPKYRGMVAVVPANTTATIPGAGVTGVFVADRALILGAYRLAKYETTWELWKEVRDWAASRGYSIASEGMEGHGGDTGTGGDGWAASSRKTRPVTGVTWLDAVVWCNAYSELSGYEPVYYAADGASVLRSSDADGGEDAQVSAKREKNGFRLPAEAEWEYAARGGKTGESAWNSRYSGGDNGLPGLAWYAANAGADVEGKPAYGVHPAGAKTANRLDIFDMSGNAAEWCWDWNDGNQITQNTPPDGPVQGSMRVVRGGSWQSAAPGCEVKARASLLPSASDNGTGFRVARTIPETGETVNSGDYLPTLEGTHWHWDSPWGMREIDFDTEDHATFTDPAEPPCVYDDSYTYNPALGRGNISGSYPAGDFQLRNNNKTMFIPQFRHFGHSVEFTFGYPPGQGG
jgi:formylglycine-generating enzyme required for sulfatase activity